MTFQFQMLKYFSFSEAEGKHSAAHRVARRADGRGEGARHPWSQRQFTVSGTTHTHMENRLHLESVSVCVANKCSSKYFIHS